MQQIPDFFEGKSLQAILVELALIAAKSGNAQKADNIASYLALTGANQITLAMIDAVKGLALAHHAEVFNQLKPLVEQGAYELLPFAVLAAAMAGFENEVQTLLSYGKKCSDTNIQDFCAHFCDKG